jgi:hypothetical protein
MTALAVALQLADILLHSTLHVTLLRNFNSRAGLRWEALGASPGSFKLRNLHASSFMAIWIPLEVARGIQRTLLPQPQWHQSSSAKSNLNRPPGGSGPSWIPRYPRWQLVARGLSWCLCAAGLAKPPQVLSESACRCAYSLSRSRYLGRSLSCLVTLIPVVPKALYATS